jgi:hypothetical protein
MIRLAPLPIGNVKYVAIMVLEPSYLSSFMILWPKDHDGRSHKVNGSYTHTLYTKWLVELFGTHRIALDL